MDPPHHFSGSGDLCEELRPSLPRPGGVSGLCRWSFGACNSAQKQPPHCPPREGAQPHTGNTTIVNNKNISGMLNHLNPRFCYAAKTRGQHLSISSENCVHAYLDVQI